MDMVYGTCDGPSWFPAPYAEGKGRYLWTDAFGVCNYITLWKQTGNEKYLNQASHTP